MSWAFAPTFDAAHRAALAAGKDLVFVCPPAPWAAAALFERVPLSAAPGVQTLALAPPDAVGDLARVLDALDVTRPAHPVTGIARTARLIRAGAVRTLVASPADTIQLLSRSGFAAGSLTAVAIAWPELLCAGDGGEATDTVLSECTGIARLVLTADDGAVGDFVERHARRAPIVVGARAGEPQGAARYVVLPAAHLPWAVRAALDSLDPEMALLWDPSPDAAVRWREYADDPTVRVALDPGDQAVELVLAAALPSSDALAALRRVARDVAVFVQPYQVAYLARIARPLNTLRLPSEADRARDRAFRLRESVRARLADGAPPVDLHALAPLFDEYDPALVAAALASGPAAEPAAPETIPAWVRLRLDVGRRDRVRTADVVGALLNGVGLPKDLVGRVDVRESFALVEVRAEAAERALRGLNGLRVRGRTMAARVDRR